MPLIDMPLAKLREYQGINPRPGGFDEFWDKSLAEMKALDPRLEMNEADFQTSFAECFDTRFTGVGGDRIYAKVMRPRNPADRKGPAVIMFHGYSGNSGEWVDKLGYVAAGFTVAALDCRGQGGQSEDLGGIHGPTLRGHIIRGIEDPKPENLLFRKIYLDCAQLTGLVMKMPGVDPQLIGIMGGSQGGGLTLACASLVPEVNRAAPTYPFLCDYLRVWEMDQAKDAYIELKEYFRRHDPLHERESEIFTRLGYIDVQHLTPRIRGKIMMGTGLMDTVCPPSTQFAAYNKITSTKEVLIYPDFGHEGLPGHGDRVMKFMLEMLN